ncbi:CLUMA_CG005173, isoform A [Clunio marinus]|uniref:CLUMA_CG005173, isoform A n=1 Tax=Clunio marinus TaxID=568069 RepID=A0A1J1HTW3_9DIPT|nr:CLUMA_CG005173, isoform A [Clunio marinus]
MSYDEILPHLSHGKFGKYQKRVYILLCFPNISTAFHILSGISILAIPDHRCKLDGELSNSSFHLPADVWNSSFPFDKEKKAYSKCEYFISDSNESVKCSEFIWDSSIVKSSAVKSFSLVCDENVLKAAGDSMVMLGILIGSYIFGELSDKYGRRPILLFSLLIQVVFGFLTALSPEFISFAICRVIVGGSTIGVSLVSYCSCLEMVGKQYRPHAGTVIMMFFSLGYILLGLLAYFIHDWRWLQVALTLPGILFLSYWWIIPESTRWLLANNQKEKAIAQIEKIARVNNLKVPRRLLEKLEAEPETFDSGKKHSVFDLFKTPNLRTKSILIFYNWFAISACYYGLSWGSGSLVGNQILNFILSGLVEIPAYYFLILTLNRWGRKLIMSGSMICAGAVLLLSLFIPETWTWLVLTLSMLGKMSITASFGTVYLFSTEQFPTVIRNAALGACSMSARIGGISAPFVIHLSQSWKPAPFVIFGVTAFVGGVFSTFLPETRNRELPETLDDAERI